jgi:catechol 2,3-dioxygenase-like lactoylglutathione lyase family enzyme
MLGNNNVHAIVAVKDLGAAKDFYENKLGLKKVDENPGGVMYQSGETKIFVYPSEYAGTNKANAASWEVDNIDEVIADLKSKGISFEHYDNIPGVTLEGDVHVMGTMKAAWFKDPDGNILCLGNAM